jgi:hypothetical protein
MTIPIAAAGLLAVEDHRRNASDMTYVYPVVSRRAAGVSIGINLNPNNACNWGCVYCQVPNLTRAGPPPIDLALLERELRTLLDQIVQGRFMEERVPPELRRLADIAFSGNGEPTTAAEFPEAVRLAHDVAKDYLLDQPIKIRLITNGSQLDRIRVREGIGFLGDTGGEVWFKLDAGTSSDTLRINRTRGKTDVAIARLLKCCELAETWVQSCFFAFDGDSPSDSFVIAYLDALAAVKHAIAGVYVYGIARPSMQADAGRLSRLPAGWLDQLAERIRAMGLEVRVSP